jgi:hypothetical protein
LDFVTFSANVKKWKKEKEEKWDKRLEARRKAGKNAGASSFLSVVLR